MKHSTTLMLVTALGLACACKSEKEIEVQRMVSTSAIELTINAQDLLDGYTKDKQVAETKYKDKIVLVEAEVTDIDTLFVGAHRADKDSSGGLGNYIFNWFIDNINDPVIALEKEVHIAADSTRWSVKASFPTEYFEEVKKIKLNQKVKLKCKCTGYSTIREVDSKDKTLQHWNSIFLRGCIVQ